MQLIKNAWLKQDLSLLYSASHVEQVYNQQQVIFYYLCSISCCGDKNFDTSEKINWKFGIS